MKNIMLIILFLSSVCLASGSGNDYTFPVALISSAQEVTSVWADVGNPIEVTGYKRIGLDINLQILDANNVRLRWVRQETSGGTDRLHIIETVGASSVSIAAGYYEFGSDSDQNISLDFDIFPINYVQLQTQAGTEGASTAQLNVIKYFLIGE